MPTATELLNPLKSAPRYYIEYAAIACAYFLTAIGGLFIFSHYNTSPALIWLPVGIAAAATMRLGYRVWMPVFLAQFFAALTYTGSITTALVSAAAYAIEFAILAYLIARLKFAFTFDRTRTVVAFVGFSFIVTTVAPLIVTIFLQLDHALSSIPLLNFSRAWTAGVFSMLIVTPTVLSWFPRPFAATTTKQGIEIAAAFLALTAIDVFLFWTPYAQFAGISVIFFIPAILIWFALRFHPRWLTLGIALTSVLGIAGSIVTIPGTALSQQLFSDEIYIGMVAAIFYVFVAVVEERRQAYRDLESAYRTTIASDQAKNEFIAILAHELRNPLAPIVSSLELLSLDAQSDESRSIIRDAQQNTVMIRRLLDDLLDTVRLSQRKFTLRKEAVRIGDIIDASVASIADAVSKKQLKLSVKTRCKDLIACVDPVRAKQILINLLNNACKYTHRGGSIDLRCEEHGDDVVIRVRDTGIGITPALAERIFEPFKQLNEQEHYSSGLGIGLYLTKQLAAMHGGSISVESDGPGKGSTFTVRLPIAKSELGSLPTVSSSSSADARRILIVDDNEPAAKGLQRLLTKNGHDVRVVHRANDAFAVIASYEPDAILLDIGLPDMSGHDVARRLREGGYSARIIAITGYGQDTDREQALLAGCDVHLTKPVGIADLLDALDEHPEPVLT